MTKCLPILRNWSNYDFPLMIKHLVNRFFSNTFKSLGEDTEKI